jgi:hypothetical protein
MIGLICTCLLARLTVWRVVFYDASMRQSLYLANLQLSFTDNICPAPWNDYLILVSHFLSYQFHASKQLSCLRYIYISIALGTAIH